MAVVVVVVHFDDDDATSYIGVSVALASAAFHIGVAILFFSFFCCFVFVLASRLHVAFYMLLICG